jgi:hypothetical protein
MFLEALTVGSALMVVYHHVGYPILLKRLTRKRRPVFTDIAARGHRSQPGDAQLPSFTIVIPAYNEADIIADKIRNLAALDYPEDRLNVIVACDGCSDQTAARARRRRTGMRPSQRHRPGIRREPGQSRRSQSGHSAVRKRPDRAERRLGADFHGCVADCGGPFHRSQGRYRLRHLSPAPTRQFG